MLILQNEKTILVFSLLILAIILLFQFSKYALISNNLQTEVIIAIVFFFVGILIHKKSLQKPVLSSTEINHKKIAAVLFLSESTIKTHVSNFLVKLDAKRTTQTIQIAKSYQII